MASQTPSSIQPAELNPEHSSHTAASENVDPTVTLSTDQKTEVVAGESGAMEELQGAMIESQVFEPNQGNTLRRRLLLTLMPTTIVPLVIAGFFGFQVEKQRVQQEALGLLQEKSFLSADIASEFVEHSLQTPATIAKSPSTQQLLQKSSEKVAEGSLAGQEIVELEEAFADTKLLLENSGMNQYLAQMSELKNLAEVFITEKNGFNVAYSSPISDFVQRDESWWRKSKEQGQHIGSPEYSRANESGALSVSEAIRDEKTGEFLGVIRARVLTKELEERIATSIQFGTAGASQAVQILDAENGIAFNPISDAGVLKDSTEVIGGATIATLALVLHQELRALSSAGEQLASEDLSGASTADSTGEAEANEGSGISPALLESIQTRIIERTGINSAEITAFRSAEGDLLLRALAQIGTKNYALTTVSETDWVSIASVDVSEVESAGNDLIMVFAATTTVLSLAATVVLLLLASQLSAPLKSLTTTAEEATTGNFDIRANLQGTVETQTLGQVFNTLLNQIQGLLNQQQQAAAEQQTLREELEEDISLLMEDISDAADGDLRVRAKLTEGDVGIIADLFNAIIENLRLTTIQVKSSTGEVTTSLAVNEAAIRELAEQAIDEARSLKETMEAVEDISCSIQEVATNAGQASRLTKDTYTTVQAGTESMDKTVESILGLRSTVGETAKKIKRLGESAQKISQAVGLIDEIALKTNLLAVNASVEAARAGEMGQGFTAVAEQVGSLAEQSSSATKEIAQIVASIQNETQEVVESIETGTAQVVNSTNLVENTKRRLAEVLLKSEQINELMQKISASTSYQTESSAAVTALVKQATEESEQRSESSSDMAQAIQQTASIARELQASVEQFKVDEATGETIINETQS